MRATSLNRVGPDDPSSQRLRDEADRTAFIFQNSTTTGPNAGGQSHNAIVDDHSRLADVELHDDEKAQTVTAFVEAALAWFARRGVVCQRGLTDNAWSYTHNRSLAALLAYNQIRHVTIAPTLTANQRQRPTVPPNHGPRSGVAV